MNVPRPTMQVEPVIDIVQAQEIRRIRNGFATYMTHQKQLINEWAQANWFNNVYLPANERGEMFAFHGVVGDRPMAYGLVNKKDDRYWLTGGITESHRGVGYGRELFQHLIDFTIEHCAPDVWLDVLETNEPALELYKSLGFQAVTAANGVIVMERSADV